MLEKTQVELEEKSVFHSKTTAGILTLLTLPLFILTCFLLLNSLFGHVTSGRSVVMDVLIFSLSVWFIGKALWFFIHLLLKKTPALVINQQGLTISQTTSSTKLVPWEDIDSVYLSGGGLQKWISVKVKDGNKYLGIGPSPIFQKMNYWLLGASFYISTLSLKHKNIEELVDLINAYLKANQNRDKE